VDVRVAKYLLQGLNALLRADDLQDAASVGPEKNVAVFEEPPPETGGLAGRVSWVFLGVFLQK
jgi:hypothetical protein